MVAPDKALPARPGIRIPRVISQLDDLVHPTMAVTEVSLLRFAEMDAEALKTYVRRGNAGGIYYKRAHSMIIERLTN
jgi:hypothetical protein